MFLITHHRFFFVSFYSPYHPATARRPFRYPLETHKPCRGLAQSGFEGGGVEAYTSFEVLALQGATVPLSYGLCNGGFISSALSRDTQCRKSRCTCIAPLQLQILT